MVQDSLLRGGRGGRRGLGLGQVSGTANIAVKYSLADLDMVPASSAGSISQIGLDLLFPKEMRARDWKGGAGGILMAMEPMALAKSANKLRTKKIGSDGIFWNHQSDQGSTAVP